MQIIRLFYYLNSTKADICLEPTHAVCRAPSSELNFLLAIDLNRRIQEIQCHINTPMYIILVYSWSA